MLAILLLELLSSPALAFLRHEHEWVSDKALCLVIHDLEREKGPSSRRARAIEVLRGLQGHECHASYAQITSYPDDVTHDEALVDTTKSGLHRIHTIEVQNAATDFLAKIGEVRINSHHFRLEALQKFHTDHAESVALALQAGITEDDDLFVDAIARNAFADHFLQDALAPGHMTDDARDKSHMQNNRLHDLANYQGRRLRVRTEVLNELLSQLGDDSAARKDALEDCFSQAELQIVEQADFYGDGEDAAGPACVVMRGDGELYGPEMGLNDELAEQGLLMTLLLARSIRDPVDTFVDETPTNFFDNQQCKTDDDRELLRCYYVDEERPQATGDRACETGQSFAGFEGGQYESIARPWYEPLLWPEVGVGFELQRIRSASRLQLSPELRFNLPLGLAPESLAFTWAVGGSYVGWAQDYDGYGPDLHLYMDIKPWSTFAALDLGYRFYAGQGTSGSRPRGSARVGLTNGVLSGFFSFGYDSTIEGGRLRDDSSTFGLGVSANVSLTELRHLFHDRD